MVEWRTAILHIQYLSYVFSKLVINMTRYRYIHIYKYKDIVCEGASYLVIYRLAVASGKPMATSASAASDLRSKKGQHWSNCGQTV